MSDKKHVELQKESYNGGGFTDDLLSLGGSLMGTVGEAFRGIAGAHVEAKMSQLAAKSAQQETAQNIAPIKGVNEKGDTVVVTEKPKTVAGFEITPKHAMIGGGVLVISLLAYIAIKK